VNIVNVSPGRKAHVEHVPLTAIRQLHNIGSLNKGVSLPELQTMTPPPPDAYVKVFVQVDRPLPGLADQVREIVPNAVDIVVQRAGEEPGHEAVETRGLSATELFAAYYQREYEAEPSPELYSLFSRLYEEASASG
jgi:hypothetical protein